MDRSEWVLVPRKVTREMLIAYWDDGDDEAEPLDQSLLTDGDLAKLQLDWDRILSAAPPPPAEQASEEHLETLREIRLAYGDAPNHFTAEKAALDHAIAALSQRPVVDYNGPYGVRAAWDRITSSRGFPCDYEVVGKALSTLAAQQPEKGEG